MNFIGGEDTVFCFLWTQLSKLYWQDLGTLCWTHAWWAGAGCCAESCDCQKAETKRGWTVQLHLLVWKSPTQHFHRDRLWQGSQKPVHSAIYLWLWAPKLHILSHCTEGTCRPGFQLCDQTGPRLSKRRWLLLLHRSANYVQEAKWCDNLLQCCTGRIPGYGWRRDETEVWHEGWTSSVCGIWQKWREQSWVEPRLWIWTVYLHHEQHQESLHRGTARLLHWQRSAASMDRWRRTTVHTSSMLSPMLFLFCSRWSLLGFFFFFIFSSWQKSYWHQFECLPGNLSPSPSSRPLLYSPAQFQSKYLCVISQKTDCRMAANGWLGCLGDFWWWSNTLVLIYWYKGEH